MSTTPSPEPGPDPGPGRAPAPLLVASGLVLVEGLVLLMLGISELVTLDSERLTMGITVTVFFVGFALLLVVCAWELRRLHSWARGPVLLSQLIALGLAWNFRGGATLPVSVGLAVVAVVVLAGLLHPSSVEALERAADRS